MFASSWVVAISLLCIAPAGCQTLWTGSSGGYKITWSSTELLAQDSSGKTVFSAHAAAEQGFQSYSDEMKGERVGRCSYTRTFKPLSLVGPLLSFRDELETSCEHEAHPGFSERLTTIDLSAGEIKYIPDEENDYSIAVKPSKGIVSLEALFPSSSLLQSLNSDPLLARSMSSPAKSPAEIPDDVKEGGIAVPSQPCSFELPPDYLTRFIFHHSERGKVAIRLQLVPKGGACHAERANLGLLLPIPEKNEAAVSNAKLGKEGFLAVNAPAQKGRTVIEFHVDTGN